MKIPKSFELGGYTWKVVEFDNKERRGDHYGRTVLDKLTIEIERGIPRELKEQTFLHELLHAIEFAKGKNTDQHDEREIDSTSMFLHQYYKTAK